MRELRDFDVEALLKLLRHMECTGFEFKPEYLICKYDDYHASKGLIDAGEYGLYAYFLIEEWSRRVYEEGKPFFSDQHEIRIASFLLHDDLLPDAARKAFSFLMMETLYEATECKLKFNTLFIKPPPRGRVGDSLTRHVRYSEVGALRVAGETLEKASELVAEKHNVSPTTIRREYNRLKKEFLEKARG